MSTSSNTNNKSINKGTSSITPKQRNNINETVLIMKHHLNKIKVAQQQAAAASSPQMTEYQIQNKLHNIYNALDCHQYNKAIKFCNQLPKTHTLGQALLAHCYQKNNQRYKSLCIIYNVLVGREYVFKGPGASKPVKFDDDNEEANWYYELESEIYRDSCSINTCNELSASSSDDNKKDGGDKSKVAVSSTSRLQAMAQKHLEESVAAASKKKGGGKKAKKKGGGGNNTATAAAAASSTKSEKKTTTQTTPSFALDAEEDNTDDVIDTLESPVYIPSNWDGAPKEYPIITDETILATIGITLQSMRYYITTYQMYLYAIHNINAGLSGDSDSSSNSPENTVKVLSKALMAGLHLLLLQSTSSDKQCISILSSMQLISLQLSKLGLRYAPLWSTRIVLWQITFLLKEIENSTEEDPDVIAKYQQKLLMLPRLAESLATKAIASTSSQDEHIASCEDYTIYLQTLEQQESDEKLALAHQIIEKLEELSTNSENGMDNNNNSNNDNSSHNNKIIPMSIKQILEKKASVLMKMKRYQDASAVYKYLLDELNYKDQWFYWLSYVECLLLLLNSSGDGSDRGNNHETMLDDSVILQTNELINNILMKSTKVTPASSTTELRGLHLMQVELEALKIRGKKNTILSGDEQNNNGGLQLANEISSYFLPNSNLDILLKYNSALLKAIKDYSIKFYKLASCAYSDLCPYIELLCKSVTLQQQADVDAIKEYFTSSLLNWLDLLRKDCSNVSTLEPVDNSGEDSVEETTTCHSEKKANLRGYIFCVKFQYKIIQMIELNENKSVEEKEEDEKEIEEESQQKEDKVTELLPPWTDLVKEWHETKSWTATSTNTNNDDANSDEKIDSNKNGEENSQKENQPGDELILLAVQQVMYREFDSPINRSKSTTSSDDKKKEEEEKEKDVAVSAEEQQEEKDKRDDGDGSKSGDDEDGKSGADEDKNKFVPPKKVNNPNNTTEKALSISFALLEMAMKHSPHNAYLKIAAMDVYSKWNASSLSWELYRKLDIKHIQLDSCSYLIIQTIIDGGLYNEVIKECSDILKLHNSTMKDTGEYMARSMERGTISKADEFLFFQRYRMNNSLSLLQVKGYVMDCAPLVYYVDKSTKKRAIPTPIGQNYGITGYSTTDLKRAIGFAKEIHNMAGAPSIINVNKRILTNKKLRNDDVEDNSVAKFEDSLSDNRDLSILSNQILHCNPTISKNRVVNDTLRRGHIHGLLVRAVLVMEVCKGPKKGKIQKNSLSLEKRSKSLLKAISETNKFILRGTEKVNPGYNELMKCMVALCRVIVVLASGMSESPSAQNNDIGEVGDSVSEREKRICEILPAATDDVKGVKSTLKLTEVNDTEKRTSTTPHIAKVCRILPDMVVSLFALLDITSNVYVTFGWSKRKRKTRPSVAALGDLALAFRDLVREMVNVFWCCPHDGDDKAEKASEIASKVQEYVSMGLIDEQTTKESSERIIRGQRQTGYRVVSFLEHLLATLDTYDVSDES